MSEHPNVTTVNSMTESIFSQDLEALSKVFTPDLRFHLRGPHPVAGDYDGVEGMVQAMTALIESSGGKVVLDQQYCIAADGWVTEWERAEIGRPQDDQTIESYNSFVYRFEGPRISEMWVLLGALPELAEAHFG